MKHKTLEELLDFFQSVSIPKEPIRLNKFTVITDYKLFLYTTFAELKEHPGNKTFLPSYKRLITLYEILKN